MIIDGILATIVAFMAVALGRAVLLSSVVDWRRDVTMAGLLLLLGILLGMWRLLPRHATRATRNLRQLIGPAVLGCGIVLILAGLYSTLGPHHEHGALPFFSAIYKAVQFFPLNGDPGELRARWSRGEWLVALFAVLLFVGVATQGIVLLFHESLSNARLLLANRHVVICGVGRIGHQLVDDLVNIRNDGRTVVVIERDPEHPDLPWLREQGVVVITGAAQRADVLQKARVRRADEVFVVTGSDEINVECVVELRDQLRGCRRREPLRCHVHLRDRDLASSMRERLVPSPGCSPAEKPGLWPAVRRWLESFRSRESAGSGEAMPEAVPMPIDVEVFNTTERTVRRLFESLAAHHIDRLPMQAGEIAHVVIIGFGEFGQNLAVSLAELCHFPNCQRMRMTICDQGIKAKEDLFRARFPRFTHAAGAKPSDDWSEGPSGGIEYVCNATFEELTDVGDETWVKRLDARLTMKDVKPLVFVCFDNDSVNFKLAERLKRARDRLGDRFDANGSPISAARVRADRWPVHVWIPAQRELSQLLEERGSLNERPDPIPFGRCFGAVSYSEVTGSWADRLAIMLRYGYVGFDGVGNPGDDWNDLCAAVPGLPCGTPPPPVPRKSWETQLEIASGVWRDGGSEAYRASDRSAAIHAVVKLAALGFAIIERGREREPDARATREAVRGMLVAAKTSDGLKVKDDKAQIPHAQSGCHPNLERLPVMEHYRWCSERLLGGWQYTPEPPSSATDLQNDLKLRQFKHWLLQKFENLYPKPDGGSGVPAENPSIPESRRPDSRQLDCKQVHVLLALAADGRLFDMRKIVVPAPAGQVDPGALP